MEEAHAERHAANKRKIKHFESLENMVCPSSLLQRHLQKEKKNNGVFYVFSVAAPPQTVS